MALNKMYNPGQVEPALLAQWQEHGIYQFDLTSDRPVYSIDTPPPTVSGHLHIGHVFSYSHADFMARFFRMNGRNVYYPMGYDDNGLPTERLVEKRYGTNAAKLGRQAFIELCLCESETEEAEYRALFERLGLSVDWRYTYRTIDPESRRVAQLSFIRLVQQGLAYRRSTPAIWCPECHTSIAQADLDDLERDIEFVTLPFELSGGGTLPIATTRPELLAACVAVFIHPQDGRYAGLAGQSARDPLYGTSVPILADPAADPSKGTGAVMCCTFGDQTDVAWWFIHKLGLVEAIDPAGRMTAITGELAGLTISEVRRKIKELLSERGLIIERQPVRQSIRVHERCDTPVEYIQAAQWFIRVTDHKAELLHAGEQVRWHPEAMQARYRAWVENLNWDWAISRQRTYGVPLPAWYCAQCGAVMLADKSELPVDPLIQAPPRACPCGSTRFTPDSDRMDTWATSSLSPQLAGRWLTDPELYQKVFPFSLRPQAYEIIRTWAFYTLAKSHYHFNSLPWSDVLISGWAVAGAGSAKISKSRGGGPQTPLAMIEKYSADTLRYWAASTSPGKDALVSEEKFQMGARLVTKLWNVARFAERFLTEAPGAGEPASAGMPAAEGFHFNFTQRPPGESFSPADRWILASLAQLIRLVTQAMAGYEFALAKSEIEIFFWKDLADNYLEMAKQRLYNPGHPQYAGARFTICAVLLHLLKLLAPLLPYVTDAIYQGLFASSEGLTSIHQSNWPESDPAFDDPEALQLGETLVAVATAVRRYKSEHYLALGSEFSRLQLSASRPGLSQALQAASADLTSITRALRIETFDSLDPAAVILLCDDPAVQIGLIF